MTQKLKGVTVAIIGLGGTGSFVLDLVAKTSVREIRIFDDDLLRSHNAYRGPGAVSIDELRADPPKVCHYAERYARMHKRIVPHQVRVDASNMHLLDGVDFVFVCVDNGPSRRTIAQELVRRGVQFIDVGMGLVLLEDQATLIGLLRVTTSSHKRPYDLSAQNRLPFAEAPEDDDYRRNIQIADLNMLNAALAVVRWKRLYGLYQDLSEEHHSTFALNANELTGEDAPGGA